MIVLTQFSYTSVKNCLIASSVWGDVGFAAIEVLARVVVVVAGWEGAWRRRNLTSRTQLLYERDKLRRRKLTAASHPARDIIVVESINALEIPSARLEYIKFVEGSSYIDPLAHCASSTISKLPWTMNWFICRACSANLATPSPPCFEVPNSYSNRGLSCVPIMAK